MTRSLQQLGDVDCCTDGKLCPTVYAAEGGRLIIKGWKVSSEGLDVGALAVDEDLVEVNRAWLEGVLRNN